MSAITIAVAEALGFVLLLPACVCHAWTAPVFDSVKPLKPQGRFFVDRWSWAWLNAWYANTEDGVSGQQAWVWDADGYLVPYAWTFASWVPQWAIAYAWSAWRNGANNIKRPLR